MKSVELSFNLHDLPTAQHKAGLAGLLLLVRHLQQPQLDIDADRIPELSSVGRTGLTICVTEASVQQLFDTLYDAEIRELSSKSKWAGAKPVRIDEVEEPADEPKKKPKKSKRYVYEVVAPLAQFLEQHYPDSDGVWLKLWRDMLWAIPRGRPTTRIPFNQRAADESCAEGVGMWKELVAFERDLKKNKLRTSKVSGATLLGAQAVNAEQIPFADRTDHSLLLHFWQLVVQVFVPEELDKDGNREFVGYALAIPEVADLEAFCDDFLDILHQLETGKRGYRPAEAVIDIPAQAALEFMRHLAELVQHQTADEDALLADSISGVEYMHLVKQGNNVKSMAAGRVAPNRELMKQYNEIIKPSAPTIPPYRNLLFRSGLLLALLRELPWYETMIDLLHKQDWALFVRCGDTPRIPFFGADAGNKFNRVRQRHLDLLEVHVKTNQPGTKPPPPLEMLIHRLIRNYIRAMVKDRCGLEWDDFKDKKIKDEKADNERVAVPKEYAEAREKVCSAAFLGMRSRREQDFVNFFTDNICRVGQRLSDDDFQIVVNALLEQPQNVKTIAMLSISANS